MVSPSKLDISNATDTMLVFNIVSFRHKPNDDGKHQENNRARSKAAKPYNLQKGRWVVLEMQWTTFHAPHFWKWVFSNKCAYPKVRETIAWYLLCFWSTGTTLEWTQCNSMLPKIQSGCFANILLMFCWSASKLLRLQEVNRLTTYIYLSVLFIWIVLFTCTVGEFFCTGLGSIKDHL